MSVETSKNLRYRPQYELSLPLHFLTCVSVFPLARSTSSSDLRLNPFAIQMYESTCLEVILSIDGNPKAWKTLNSLTMGCCLLSVRADSVNLASPRDLGHLA